MRAFFTLVRRDLRLAVRQGADTLTVLFFFVLAIVLFPLGIGTEEVMLSWISTGVIWVMALLASTLSLERLFLADFEDGSLELLALVPASLEIQVLAKVAAHWLLTGLPLLIVAPALALMLGMDPAGLPILVATLLLGTPVLSLVGAIAAALSLGARRGGVLLPLLTLPLYVPILIFGAAAVDSVLGGADPQPHLMILGGALFAALALAPWTSAAALRQAVG